MGMAEFFTLPPILAEALRKQGMEPGRNFKVGDLVTVRLEVLAMGYHWSVLVPANR